MALAVLANDLSDAVDEARSYNRMGALDDQVLADIAHDYGVTVAEIREELDWENSNQS